MVDEHRGTLTRSAYVRGLIEGVSPQGTPRLIKVVSERKHLHRFKDVGDPIRYFQGMPVYLKACECGETKQG